MPRLFANSWVLPRSRELSLVTLRSLFVMIERTFGAADVLYACYIE